MEENLEENMEGNLEENMEEDDNDYAPEESYSYQIQYDTKSLIGILKKDRKWKDRICESYNLKETELMRRLDLFYQILVNTHKTRAIISMSCKAYSIYGSSRAK